MKCIEHSVESKEKCEYVYMCVHLYTSFSQINTPKNMYVDTETYSNPAYYVERKCEL